ncbi:hypothetical protein BGW80DRAFT_1254535 [Lactifluus volemus]|nr:hypothetical protein BGW80DRAFT_1254535 [Lactifluus volemus]
MLVAVAALRLTPSTHTPKRMRVYSDPNYLLSQFSNFVGQHAMASKMVFNRTVSVNRLVSVIAEEYGRRPYSVGFLVIGLDHIGPHPYKFSPTDTSFDLEDLIRHWLHALREMLQQNKELATINTSISILGPCGMHEAEGTPVNFRILEGTPVEVYTC